MSKAYVEIDFFQMEKLNNASSNPSIDPERAPSSFRGIQSVVSRINPQLLKTVMAAGQQARSSDTLHTTTASPTSTSNPPSPSRTTSPPPPLPLRSNPSSRCSSPAPDHMTAPLTIFYNGTVTTVNVPRHKAEAIMRMAKTTGVEMPEDALLDGNQLEGDMPIARKKSLHRFLEKRKERLASASPYTTYHKFIASCPC